MRSNKGQLCIYMFMLLSLCLFCAFALYISAQEDIAEPYLEAQYGEQKLRISAWVDAETEQRYFFMPSAIRQGNGFRLRLPKNAELLLGTDRLRDGDSLPFWFSSAEGVLRYPGDEAGAKSERFVFMESSPLPAVFIETKSGSLDWIHSFKGNEEGGFLLATGADGGIEYMGALSGLKTRGESSLAFEKKKYTLTFPFAVDLLGMGGARTWLLCANAQDTIGLRNHIVSQVAAQADMPYAVDGVFVDLYINQEYRGLYQLMEKIEVGASRVAIADLAAATQAVNRLSLRDYPSVHNEEKKYYEIPSNPEDITGGYIMEADFSFRYDASSSGFVTALGRYLTMTAPKYISLEQVDYISQIVNEAEAAFYAEGGIHPNTGKAFTEYIDLSSWVKKYLIDELFLNIDADASSAYLFKPSGDSLLYAGPVWDYDFSMMVGLPSAIHGRDLQACNPEAFLASKRMGDRNPWYQELYRQPVFYEALVAEYRDVLRPIVEEWLDGALYDAFESIRSSLQMNNLRWQELGLPLEEERQLEALEEVHRFLAMRADFLDRVWVGQEPYYAVHIVIAEGGFDLCVQPGETLFDQLARNAPVLQDQAFFRDEAQTIPFNAHEPITEDAILYFELTLPSQPDQQDEPIEAIQSSPAAAPETQYAVLVSFWNGGGEGFYVAEGQSFWEGVLQQREDWHGLQFTTDPYHTVEFDVFAPITENTTVYLKPASQNVLLFAALAALGAALGIVELHRNHLRIKRKGGRAKHGRKSDSLQT